MKKYYLVVILVLILTFFVPSNISYADSKSYLAMATISEDTLLYSKNENMKLPMASTTKIFTALTVIENCKNLDDKVIVPKEAIKTEGTSIYLAVSDEENGIDLSGDTKEERIEKMEEVNEILKKVAK